MRFHYNKDIDTLVKQLSKYKVEKLLISEQTLEDTFMNYYERRGER